MTMNPNALFITGLLMLPAVALVTWAWFAMARVGAEVRSLKGFEGMHFEI